MFVKEINSKKVTIYGQVHRPRQLQLRRVDDAGAGHQQCRWADGDGGSRSHPRDPGARRQSPDSSTVNLREVSEGKSTFYLQPGDEIFVPERVLVSGEHVKPRPPRRVAHPPGVMRRHRGV